MHQSGKPVSFWEKLTVAVKFLVLTGFAVAGIVYARPELLSPEHYPPTRDIQKYHA